MIWIFFSAMFSKSDMSRLRLAAGSAIMKLAQEPCYHEIITPEQFQLCALVINVSNCIRIEVTLNWVLSPFAWAFVAATLSIFCSSLQLSQELLKFQFRMFIVLLLFIFLKKSSQFHLECFFFFFSKTRVLMVAHLWFVLL